jgi:class 3 adenylate cyclase
VRKTVTVLFCDVTGSTALGEQLDPEALRRTMGRYFEEIRAVVERHGGLVEKFIGDAVMAVFGIPTAHEDDALRAVRAVAEIRERLQALGEELAVSLSFRTGVNTGEVVAGTGETLVTGDAVNVAARLEQAAAPGEVLIGAETHRLVRNAVTVEPVEPLAVKGKREPVPAFRLVAVDPLAPGVARHLDAPLVGRVREQARLRDDFEDVVAGKACHLFTLLGPAGVGKSRLVGHFLGEVAETAEVWQARCLHYGDDITYWPLVEMLIQMGVEPDAVIGGSPAETQLAFRRLLEERAAVRPQILHVDDLHWAEPLFLDLVEHIADWSRDAPILLLCVARPELLESRPGWGGGKLNATTILVEPLSPEDSGVLISHLASESGLSEHERDRIVAAAGGNPLFLEEMLAMASENRHDGTLVIPPTIQALLQARLDRLDEGEREVVGCAAIEGQVFHGLAVLELAGEPTRPAIPSHLLSLVRKELIRPERTMRPEDEAYRFRHLLIRDAAYDSLPKETRADLHERFATWLESHVELVELDEIVGYHLEQAHRHRTELDASDPLIAELATRAAARLGQASRRAASYGDISASVGLLERSVGLLPAGHPGRLDAVVDLVDTLSQVRRTEDSRTLVGELERSGDPRYLAYASLAGNLLDLFAGGYEREQTQAVVQSARAVFEELGDDRGLAYCWFQEAAISWAELQAEETRAAASAGLPHATRAGVAHLVADLNGWEFTPLVFGPVHVDEALRLVDAGLERTSGRMLLESRLLSARGRLLAMRGDVDTGRELVRIAVQRARDAGLQLDAAAAALALIFIEEHAGDLEALRRVGYEGVAELEELGDRVYLPTIALTMAVSLVLAGRAEEAEPLCRTGREVSAPDDLVNHAYADVVDGHLLALRGEVEEGERILRRGVETCERTDFYELRGHAHEILALTMALVGRADEAREAAEGALAIFEAKGDEPAATRARALLESVSVSV